MTNQQRNGTATRGRGRGRPSLPSFQLTARPYDVAGFMFLSSSMTKEQITDRLHVMKQLEMSSYTRNDYLYSDDSPYYTYARDDDSDKKEEDDNNNDVVTTSSSSPSCNGECSSSSAYDDDDHYYVYDYASSISVFSDAMYVLGPIHPPSSRSSSSSSSSTRCLCGTTTSSSTTTTTPSSSSACSKGQTATATKITPSPSPPSYHPYMNEKTRQIMIDLLYEIADYCHFRRETVAYAVQYIMDRYFSTTVVATSGGGSSSSSNKESSNNNTKPSTTTTTTTATTTTTIPIRSYQDVQLIASTSLYIAVKLLEPVSMDVTSLADLSKGSFTSQDILQMECKILFALQWNISHGPTPIAFAQHYMSLLRLQLLSDDDEDDHDDDDDDDLQCVLDLIMEQAQYQIELSVMNYKLSIHHDASEVALAAMWNAMEAQLSSLSSSSSLTSTTTTTSTTSIVQQWEQLLWSSLARTSSFDVIQMKKGMGKIQLKLCKLQYEQQQQQQQQEEEEKAEFASREQQEVTSATRENEKATLQQHMEGGEEDRSDNETTTTTMMMMMTQTVADNSNCNEEQGGEEATERGVDDDSDDDDDDGCNNNRLHPSPVSVATNQLSANTKRNKAHDDDNDAPQEYHHQGSYYDFSFLKRLFFP